MEKAKEVVAIPNVIVLYHYDNGAVSAKYALKIGQATMNSGLRRKKLIKDNKLNKQCEYIDVGMCWVGTMNYVRALYNRDYKKREIMKFIRNPYISKNCLRIIFMKKKNMRWAQISRRQKIGAGLLILGLYKNALKYA
jgi:hypothetical protein